MNAVCLALLSSQNLTILSNKACNFTSLATINTNMNDLYLHIELGYTHEQNEHSLQWVALIQMDNKTQWL